MPTADLVLLNLCRFQVDFTSRLGSDIGSGDRDIAVLLQHNGGLAALECELIARGNHDLLSSSDIEVLSESLARAAANLERKVAPDGFALIHADGYYPA